MFSSARFRLTLLYCAIFFAVFWLFSGGLYFWMSHSYGESYVNRVTQTEAEQTGNNADTRTNEHAAETATIAGDISLAQLRDVLIALNGALLLLVPTAAWLLTDRSLRPVREAYGRQREFVSDASHELRTPLTVIRGELDLALKKKRRSGEYVAALDTTRAEITRLQRLVDDLLLLAHNDSGQRVLTYQSLDLVEVLNKVSARLLPYASDRSVRLSWNPPPQPLLVAGTQSMLERLFENVITNAIKYSESGKAVIVSLEQLSGKAVVKVSDNGSGMSRQVIERAFDRFYRGSESRTESGFGLGLAISKSITDRHGGTISITSAKDKGTDVIIKLPLGTPTD